MMNNSSFLLNIVIRFLVKLYFKGKNFTLRTKTNKKNYIFKIQQKKLILQNIK